MSNRVLDFLKFVAAKGVALPTRLIRFTIEMRGKGWGPGWICKPPAPFWEQPLKYNESHARATCFVHRAGLNELEEFSLIMFMRPEFWRC